MLHSTDWIQFNVFFKKAHCHNEMFAISLRKSCQDFFASKHFPISRFMSQFPSCKIPSSNSNATFYTIPKIDQDYTWNVSRFPNLFHCFKSLLKLQSVCNFGTWDTTYVGFYKLWGRGYVPVLLGFMYSSLVYFSCDYQTVLFHKMH